MLVQRVEWQIKVGQVQEALALLREVVGVPNVPLAKRVYSSRIGRGAMIALEWEWKSMAEYEKAWEWNATPAAAAFYEKWNKLMRGNMQEIWDLVER